MLRDYLAGLIDKLSAQHQGSEAQEQAATQSGAHGG
jgi:hypothetical protein